MFEDELAALKSAVSDGKQPAFRFFWGDGNLAKFSQNEALRRYSLSTREQILVEASPLDRVWGIGMSATHAHADDPRQWLGLNLLGFALMRVRERLQKA